MKIRYLVLLKSKVLLEQMYLAQARLVMQKRPIDRGVSETRNAKARRNRITNTRANKPGRRLTHLPSEIRAPVRRESILAARAFVFALLLCLGSVHGWAEQNDQQQMRGLDEQVQEIKSDVLSIAAELRLEEKLLYPSGTQVAMFAALAKGDQMRLDAVRLQIDGHLVAHYIYFKELEALRKGGVQRIYVGNVATGDHQLEVLVDGKLEGGDLRELYFGEAIYHALQGRYFDAPQRLDTELALYHGLDQPERDTPHYHINDAEFSVGGFELNYRGARNPTLKGRMVLRLTIEPDGSVSMCALQSSDTNAPDLAAQVVSRVKTMNFGAKEVVQAVTIVYPIDFLPAA